MSNANMSRRTLLGGAAASAVTAMAATSAHAAQVSDIKRWDATYDVVVVGYGGAGAAAAIEAHDNGAKVCIVEKMPQAGGNTGVSGGGIMIPDNGDDAYEYLSSTYKFADSVMDEKLLRRFCDEIVKQRDFLKTLGDIQLTQYGVAGFKTLPKAETIKRWSIKGPGQGGHKLFSLYQNAVENVRKIPVRLNCPAKQLVRKGDAVVGVVCEENGKTISIRARKAVILTTGGYEYSEEMLRTYAQGTSILGTGNPGNTGDGIRLAQSAGAQLWHMTAYSCSLGVKLPGHKAAFYMVLRTPNAFYVDQDGKRFIDERSFDNHTCLYVVQQLDPVHHRYPRIPCYVIFDEAARKAGPITPGIMGSGWAANREGYKWSADNSQEVASGVIKKADTIEGLAKEIGVPAENLKATLEKWNKDMKDGKDTVFGRTVTRKTASGNTTVMAAALSDSGPYYALPLYPTVINTQGGPRKTVDGQIINALGEPIPRLFGAGELGSLWGSIYQGATNNAECLVFGRLAGRAAAKLKNWS